MDRLDSRICSEKQHESKVTLSVDFSSDSRYDPVIFTNVNSKSTATRGVEGYHGFCRGRNESNETKSR
jgi:hypothetical protein